MRITGKDRRVGRAPVKRNIASLVGAFVIGFGCLILWWLVAEQAGHATPLVLGIGVAVCLAIGVWTRVADL